MEKRWVRMGILAGLGVMLGVVCGEAAFADEHKVPSQYATIQAAINAAGDGDTVLVGDGTYTGTDNKNLAWSGKYITVKSENGAGKSIIDCGNAGRAFRLEDLPAGGNEIIGFTIENGQVSENGSDGGGIWCENSSPAVMDCVIKECDVAGSGGAIYCAEGSAPVITSCLISGNAAGEDGGGIACCSASTPAIRNCTIVANEAGENGGGIHCSGSSTSPTVTGCILWNDGAEMYLESSASATVTYSAVEADYSGMGNIDSSPSFCNADNDDYRLRPNSPCIDAGYDGAGVPDTDLAGNPRIQYPGVSDGPAAGDPPVDIGAYEAVPAPEVLLYWSTFLGGNYVEWLYGLAVDSAGCAYVTGHMGSSDFPVTSGVYDDDFTDGWEIFVTKLNSDGSGLEYSTFLGDEDTGTDIAVDSAGCAYLCGWSEVAKLEADGSGFVYTYDGLTGAQSEYLTVDSSGCVYVTGISWDENFPITSGAYQSEPKPFCEDYVLFASKLNAAGNALEYSTLLGAKSPVFQNVLDVAVDSSGCAYVAGYAYEGINATSGAWRETKTEETEGFLIKFNATGTDAVYATWLGEYEYGSEEKGGIAVDSSGHAYAVLNSMDDDWVMNTQIVKLAPDAGSATVRDIPGSETFGLAVDSSNCVYVTGHTIYESFPVATGAYDDSPNGGWDVVLTKFDAQFSRISHSTYLGGSDDDKAWDLAVDSSGNAYVAGRTESSDFPVTGKAYDQSFNGGYLDNFVAKLVTLAPSSAYALSYEVQPQQGWAQASVEEQTTPPYYYGDQAHLHCEIEAGCTLDYWTVNGENAGSASGIYVTMTEDAEVVAHVDPINYTLTTSVSPYGTGAVMVFGHYPPYHYNDEVELLAWGYPPYWQFGYWSGDVGGYDNPKTITITGDTSVTANFFYYGGGCR